MNAAANAVQMQVALGQGTDQAGITGGAEASGLLNAAISSIRTVSAFNMQNHIQTLYKKVRGRTVGVSWLVHGRLTDSLTDGLDRAVALLSWWSWCGGGHHQAIAPLSKDRKVRGLVQGVIFGTTNLLLYATYGKQQQQQPDHRWTTLYYSMHEVCLLGAPPRCCSGLPDLTRCVLLPASPSGLLFWFGGKLVSKGTYTFQEM